MRDIKELITISEKLDELRVKYGQLSWVQYTAGYDLGLEDAYKKLMLVYEDRNNFDIILKHREKSLSPEDARRTEIMYQSFKDFHLNPELNVLKMKIQKKTTDLSHILNTHRSELDGKEINAVELSRIISEDPDRNSRKKAFLARAQVNKPMLDGGFIELLNLRKEYARIYGAENYVTMSLEHQELDNSIFSSWKKATKEQLPIMDKYRNEYAEKYLGYETLKPWDSAYLSGKIAPQLNKETNMIGFYEPIRKLFANFGIDISKDNTTYDIFPRKNKSEWGYNFPIKAGVDSRILANVQNRFKEYGVLLHETGHAMHSFRLDPDDVIINDGVSGIISEGIANLFGGFLYEPIFFKQFFTNNFIETETNFKQLKLWNKINMLRSVGQIMFDQNLYLQDIKTGDDINDLYWSLNKDFYQTEPYAKEPVWAATIHHTTHPIYLHNYFMGDVTCEMLKQVFCKNYNVETILDKPVEFGQFLLSKVIKPSGLYKYGELFKRISGEDFSLKYIKL